ncbi:uncharacterized protein LOC110609368 [Manihot esculenta]|uniref:uncharacterized protein LOC110609368 n=1 Tax=Manihot esculenta TaxID=3983 RepID=UPI001CC60849|nr:uncharacterized protein LOC110609368 [Manihot esculenta]
MQHLSINELSLIAQMFNERDRSCILNIPLSLSSCSDTWCWKFESKCHYSVKSAYRFLVDGFQHREGSEIWKRFWKAKVPPKVLNFCWRALVNVVPCLSSLQSKRVPVDPSCPLCHVAPENVLHILIQCPFARSCWLSSPLGWPAPSASSLNEWFSLAFSSASVENASLMLMILWALWQNRNNVVWKGQGQTASGVFFMALNFLQQWKAARVVSSVSTIVDPARPIWSPPPHGWIKANIDASLTLQRGSVGFGCVIRKDDGSFVAARAGSFYSQMDAKCAEAIAFREALSWIKECGWDRVLFELDAQGRSPQPPSQILSLSILSLPNPKTLKSVPLLPNLPLLKAHLFSSQSSTPSSPVNSWHKVVPVQSSIPLWHKAIPVQPSISSTI